MTTVLTNFLNRAFISVCSINRGFGLFLKFGGVLFLDMFAVFDYDLRLGVEQFFDDILENLVGADIK
jgi:hypothetical protein